MLSVAWYNFKSRSFTLNKLSDHKLLTSILFNDLQTSRHKLRHRPPIEWKFIIITKTNKYNKIQFKYKIRYKYIKLLWIVISPRTCQRAGVRFRNTSVKTVLPLCAYFSAFKALRRWDKADDWSAHSARVNGVTCYKLAPFRTVERSISLAPVYRATAVKGLAEIWTKVPDPGRLDDCITPIIHYITHEESCCPEFTAICGYSLWSLVSVISPSMYPKSTNQSKIKCTNIMFKIQLNLNQHKFHM